MKQVVSKHVYVYTDIIKHLDVGSKVFQRMLTPTDSMLSQSNTNSESKSSDDEIDFSTFKRDDEDDLAYLTSDEAVIPNG